MKLFFRCLWLAAVILGGMTAVGIAVGIMEKESKKYIEV
jgi:hypothetical protein